MASDVLNLICPSCDAKVTAKASLAGKKTDCPKCKFRFPVPAAAPVPAPADDEDGDPAPKRGAKSKAKSDGKGEADPKPKKGKKAAAKSGGNSKVLIGVLIGVLALAGLLVGAFFLFGQGNDTSAKGTGSPSPTRPATPTGPGAGVPTGPGGPGGPIVPGPGGPGGKDDEEEPNPVPKPPVDEPKPKPKPVGPKFTNADLTNLLPGDAKSTLHIRMDDLSSAASTLKLAFFDRVNGDLFERSLKFRHAEIAEVLHSYCGKERLPFVAIRVKSDLDAAWINSLYS